ncbi:imidazole glycerol phosphate synthase subunit HisH [Neptunicoccus cionae]|uniref:Imidazole glycerol phosphate synthase subunit HisH n=1 Tax=Neptunicoccus cionae TaxID=2035344 RepID=A0A916QYF5_9RHOB|nr:imidazole glycerol phosphate synthase subunit HisH [Amylibacter cionae]GGA21338.1 imidazole glycerol phosphate synthase subunit HisH [Amylibacter cionae]
MITAIVDYNSGNLRSAEKSFQRMASEVGGGDIIVTDDPDQVRRADRVVLPGVGAFADCRSELGAINGLFGAIEDKVKAGNPFLGICVGMQMMATWGREHGNHTGFDWIKGEVVALTPNDPALKIPHMGWNSLNQTPDHPVFDGISAGDHMYFVHSYHLVPENPEDIVATVDYGGDIIAAVGRDNIIGTQFHPEKSQATGLRLIGNFLKWAP